MAATLSEWSEGLAGMTADHIKTALDKCRMGEQWPPSIAKFRDLSGINDEAPIYPALERLPAEPATPEQVATVKRLNKATQSAFADKKSGTRCAEDIASGAWSIEREIRMQMHAKFLGHNIGNPMNLPLHDLPAFPHGAPDAVNGLVAAFAAEVMGDIGVAA